MVYVQYMNIACACTPSAKSILCPLSETVGIVLESGRTRLWSLENEHSMAKKDPSLEAFVEC